MGTLELQQVREGTGEADSHNDGGKNASAETPGPDDAAKPKSEAMQRELDKRNMSLAKSEERCFKLEAEQEDILHLLQGFREEKVLPRAPFLVLVAPFLF